MKITTYLMTATIALTSLYVSPVAEAKIRFGSKRLKAACKPMDLICQANLPPDNSHCTPCLYGCNDNKCSTPPADVDDLPLGAQKAESAGHTCEFYAKDGYTGGDCDGVYYWTCYDGQCLDNHDSGWGDRRHIVYDLEAIVDEDPDAACGVKGNIETCCSSTTVPGVGICCDNNGDTGISACGWAICIGGN